MHPHKKNPSQRKLLGISLILGISLALLIPALLFSILMPAQWASNETLLIKAPAPTYLEPIAPPLTEVQRALPAWSSGDPMLGGVNLGVDFVEYAYGDSIWSDAYQPWDTTQSTEPTNVALTRFRFGWPMRVLSYDDISTGLSVADPVVMAYHRRAYDLAGAHRGLDRPAWVPGFVRLYRVPIMVNGVNLGLDVLVWSSLVFVLLSTRTWIRKWIASRRMKRGVCVVCKYPLEDMSQCPECGTARP